MKNKHRELFRITSDGRFIMDGEDVTELATDILKQKINKDEK